MTSKYILLLIVSFLFLVGCSTKEENPKEVSKSTHAVYDAESYKRNSTVSSYTNSVYGSQPTYWYIYFTKDSDFEGFLIAKMKSSYFSLEEAHNQIRAKWKSVKEDNFIGILFFSQVSEECYNEYAKARE